MLSRLALKLDELDLPWERGLIDAREEHAHVRPAST